MTPPKTTFTRDDVIEAAVSIAEQQGLESVTARAVASRLGSSVAPVYKQFGSVGELVDADLVLLASPVHMGFYSPLLKKCVDKLLPNLMPFISLYDGECHHDPRYERYPRVGVLLQRGPDTDEEDLEILRAIAGKQAFDHKTDLAAWALTDQPAEEVADAIDRL